MRACKKPHVTRSLDYEDNNSARSSEGEEDRISELPDGVVGHILSFLPIKDAVRTSVLSRDWEHKWTSMCDLEIWDRHRSLSRDAKDACFINFVTRILMRTCNSKIRTFSLLCGQSYPNDYLETWISWVLMRKVENLKIVAHESQRLNSHWCFSGWTSLTRVELYMNCTLLLPVDIQFPNLKHLCLVKGSIDGSVKIKPERIPVTGRIILKFPALRMLTLLKCEWADVNFVEIHAPELINFRTCCLEELKNYEIKIFGAKLAMFASILGSINNFNLNTPSVSRATFHHNSFTSKENQVQKTLLLRTFKILKQLPHLTFLKLSGEIIEALIPSLEYGHVFHLFDPLKSCVVFPTFDQLKEFHLGSCSLKNTMSVLRALPPLESLTLSTLFWGNRTDRGGPWPPNICCNLQNVKLTEFCGSDVEFDFSEFILENARNLNEMLVFIVKRPGTTVEVATCRLSKVKPKSSSCRLVVDK